MLNFRKHLIKSENVKKNFYYFLIDPTKIKNLDNSTFEEFREAIDYVGKGSGNRALAQLKNAALLKQGKEIPNKKDAEKLKRIGKIWEKGSGVIIVHPFSYMSENESFFRESSIIAALGIDCLANERNGHNNHKLLPPGTRRWADHEIILLGVYCVYNAYLLFCRDRRQQIYEGDALK
uniref:Uncharacterized protein n=1 Tax=Panagrolaimus superbus TaxID=310955 RepID=A0A914YR42_9BILA